MASIDASLLRRHSLPNQIQETSLRRLVNSRLPVFSRRSHRSTPGAYKGGLRINAVAAPEKPSPSDEPFTAWGSAQQRVAKREDLKTIMILGAGPIVIGQVWVV